MLVMEKKKVAWLSVASNTFLTVGKLVAGFMTGSVSIISEAAHSAIDLIAAGIATFSVHAADRPPDHDHPYGHGKIENVSGVIEGLLIFGAAAWIIFEAVEKLKHGVELQHLGPGLAVMAVSAGLNTVVATMLKRSALAERSVALEADAAHLFTDVYTSAGVFVGLASIGIGRRLGYDVSWLDPVFAILVALLILYTAYDITRKSFLPLMDTAASEEDMACIRDAMSEFTGRGVDFHKLRTRLAGGHLHVDLHMGCRPGTSLEDGHTVSHALKARIEECIPGAQALIHVEPSAKTVVLEKDDERVRCISDELLKDDRVCGILDLEVTEYGDELRMEASLCIDPKVTMAESNAFSSDLNGRITACYPEVKEISLSFHPGDGWQSAVHQDDMETIMSIVGEKEAQFAGVHELTVTSISGRHKVYLRVGVPPSLPMGEAHRVGKSLEDDIKKIFPDAAEVSLFVEPCNEECETCRVACQDKKS